MALTATEEDKRVPVRQISWAYYLLNCFFGERYTGMKGKTGGFLFCIFVA